MGLVTIIFQLIYFVLIIKAQLRQGVECQLWLAEVVGVPSYFPGLAEIIMLVMTFDFFFVPYISKSEWVRLYIYENAKKISSIGLKLRNFHLNQDLHTFYSVFSH